MESHNNKKQGLSVDKWANSPKKKFLEKTWPGWERRVFLRWKGSLWKHVWDELLIYTILYFIISLIYRFALTEEQQGFFYLLILYCRTIYAGLPLMFILGFYVSMVVTRWWTLYNTLPWPDEVALYLRETMKGDDDHKRMVRRTIIRYCILSYILALRRHSSRLRRRYPTAESLIQTGLVTVEEMERIDEDDEPQIYTSNWWVPLLWSTEIIAQAKIDDPNLSDWVPLGQIVAFKAKLQSCKTFGNIPVPLVYNQVVTLAVYIYFGCTLIADQWVVGTNSSGLDLWYPFYGTLKFLFFWGWLSTARALYNPLGEDDEDFELNALVDRHLRVCMDIVDQTKAHPPLEKDAFWDMKDGAKLKHLDDLDKAGEDYDPETGYMSQLERNDPGKTSRSASRVEITVTNPGKSSRSSSYQRLNIAES